MGAEGERQLAAPAAEQVHHAGGDVRDAEHLAEVESRQRPALRQDRDEGVPGGERGGDLGHEAERGRLGRSDDADDAGGIGEREGQERRRHGIHAPEHGGDLVRPAGVVDEDVHSSGELLGRRKRVCARLERLGGAVEDLASVVGGAGGPGRGGLACGRHRVAHVLAGRSGDVGGHRAVRVERTVVAAGLRAHERPSQVELVGLADADAGHGQLTRRYGRSPAAPPSRPKPDSL